jgi:hypothetical protein
LALQPRLLLAAWLLHLSFALAASWFPWREIIGSLEHRPVASRAFLQGFDLELLVDWIFAYGKPMAAYQNVALVMALIYGLGVVLLESAILPAWLWPFERRQGAFFSPLLQIALSSLGVWVLLAAAIVTLRSASPIVAAIGGAIAAVFVRVILNLWKCARVSGDAGLGDALAAAARRPGSVTMLAAATLVTAVLYATVAAAAGWFSLVSENVILAIVLQQVLIFVAVYLRLWIQASTVVLWRRAALQSF